MACPAEAHSEKGEEQQKWYRPNEARHASTLLALHDAVVDSVETLAVEPERAWAGDKTEVGRDGSIEAEVAGLGGSNFDDEVEEQGT